MTWTTLLLIAAGAYFFKVSGVFLARGWQPTGALGRCLDLLPPALIAAIIAVSTFATGHHLALDARVLGVGAAAVATWRKAPFPVIVILGAVVTAIARRSGMT